MTGQTISATTPVSHPGTKTLLLGASGTGKTHSIRTLVEAGLEVFVLSTEPGIESVLGDIPTEQLHWHYIAPASVGWAELQDSAKKINSFDMKTLSGLTDINKRKYTQWADFLAQCADFVDQRTGESFGDVTEWDATRAFVVDSLSGLSIMGMNMVVGSKPVKSQGDWGIAMDNLERLINKLVMDTKCYFVLTAHPEKEMDEVLGSQILTVSSLGKKLPPKLPRYFDDVILTKRDGKTFSWSTIDSGVDLKARNISWDANMKPSFVPIVKKRQSMQ